VRSQLTCAFKSVVTQVAGKSLVVFVFLLVAAATGDVAEPGETLGALEWLLAWKYTVHNSLWSLGNNMK